MESFFRTKKVMGAPTPVIRKSELRDPPPPPKPARQPKPSQLIDGYIAFDMVAQVLGGGRACLPFALGRAIRRTVRHAAVHGHAMQDLSNAIDRLPPGMHERAKEGVLTGRWMLVLAEA